MRTPAQAIAWEFRRRHRWGLLALACYLPVLAVVKLLILESGRRINLDTPVSFAFVVVVPMAAMFTYFLAVFSFGFSGDLTGRQSVYPARAFSLPVTTAALAGWPMIYGTAAMTLLWLATRLLAVWPSGIAVPTVWPALLAASLLAWTQALMWMPYGLAGLRVGVLLLWLTTIDSIVLLALRYSASEPLMVAILAPHVPLAYLAARYAVARARRGDIPDWQGVLARLGRVTDVPTHRRARFSSASGAQAWFEWQSHGRTLPVWVAILVPVELALLFLTGNVPALVFAILAAVLLTPPFMAVFTAATVRRSNPSRSDVAGVPPFIAIRPVTSAELISAKLKATAWSTIAAWVVVLVAIPVGLRWSGTWPVVVAKTRQAAEQIGAPRVAVIALLAALGLIASTWKQLIQSLYIGLSGREWLIKGSVFVTLALLFLIGPIAQWISDDPRIPRALWDGLPLILAILVCTKMSAAAWIAVRLYHDRLLRDRTLVSGAAAWCVAVLALYGVLVWFFSTPFMPRYVLALVAILAIPLARLSAAPLALAWNRHR